MTDFRDLCAELFLFAEQAGEICHNKGLWPNCDQRLACADGKTPWLIDRARAALAEPKPEGPTEDEIASILLAYSIVEPQMGASRILHEKHFDNAAIAILKRLRELEGN